MFKLTSILGGLPIKLAIAAAAVGMAASAWFYVQSIRSDLAASKINESKYMETIAANDAVAKQVQADIVRMAKVQTQLNTELNRSQQNVIDLQKKFTQSANGQPRDLGKIAVAKPSETEFRINRGTAAALRCNELVTGAVLTKEEQLGQSINTICPDLLPTQDAAKK